MKKYYRKEKDIVEDFLKNMKQEKTFANTKRQRKTKKKNWHDRGDKNEELSGITEGKKAD